MTSSTAALPAAARPRFRRGAGAGVRALLTALALCGAAPAAPPEPILPRDPRPEAVARERFDSLAALAAAAAGETRSQDARGAIAVVFLAEECPLSRAVLPSLNDLAEREGRFVPVLGIVPRAGSRDSLAAYREGQGIRFGLAGDPDLALARALGAHVTPEALMIDSAGRILYRGAVDDRAADLRRKRPRPTRLYLDSAVAQWRGGKPVDPASTRATGCFIE